MLQRHHFAWTSLACSICAAAGGVGSRSRLARTDRRELARQLLDRPHTDRWEGRRVALAGETAGACEGDTICTTESAVASAAPSSRLQVLSLGAALEAARLAPSHSALGRPAPPPLLVKALALPPPPTRMRRKAVLLVPKAQPRISSNGAHVPAFAAPCRGPGPPGSTLDPAGDRASPSHCAGTSRVPGTVPSTRRPSRPQGIVQSSKASPPLHPRSMSSCYSGAVNGTVRGQGPGRGRRAKAEQSVGERAAPEPAAEAPPLAVLGVTAGQAPLCFSGELAITSSITTHIPSPCSPSNRIDPNRHCHPARGAGDHGSSKGEAARRATPSSKSAATAGPET